MKKIWLAVLFAVIAPIVPAIMLVQSGRSFTAVSDLPEYYAAARMIQRGRGADIYKLNRLGEEQERLFPGMNGRVVGLYVPPVAVPWLVPLAGVPEKAAAGFWMVLLLSATSGSLALLKQVFKLSGGQLLAVWAVVSVSGPLYEALRLGQLAPLLLLAFTLALLTLCRKRPLLSALALAFMLVKPHELLPFLAYAAGARRYRLLVNFLVLACVLALLSLLAVGWEGWSNYFQLMANSVAQSANMQPELGPTVRGQLLRLVPGRANEIFWLSAALALLSLGGNFAFGRLYCRYQHWLELGLVAAVPLGLVCSLHCHDYDLLLLIPSAVAALKLGLAESLPEWTKLAAILGTVLFLLPVYKFIHYDYLLGGAPMNPLFVCLLVAAASACFLAYKSRYRLLLEEHS